LLPGLGTRRLRFFSAHLRDRADGRRLWHERRRVELRNHPHPGYAPPGGGHGYPIPLPLAIRPVGAFIFGLLGDRFGRRMPLMIDIIFYSLMELLTAFSPNFTTLLIFRALYGIGMGGEWGLGASLAMETLPTEARGLFSGILQQGYAFGY